MKFLFVTGCPRSGTTALWNLLTSDRRVAMGVERYGNKIFSPAFIQPSDFAKDRFFSVKNGDTFYSELEQFSHYYKKLSGYYDECEYYGDKLPFLYKYFAKLQEGFPVGTKVLFIFRNIFDIAASYNARAADKDDLTWDRNKQAKSAVDDWALAIRNALHATESSENNDLDCFLVQYEALFLSGVGLEQLFGFLNLDVKAPTRERYIRLRQRAENLENGRERRLGFADIDYIVRNAPFGGYRNLINSMSRYGMVREY